MTLVDELLQGAIELHVHSNPCMYERRVDNEELARQAKDAGMKAVVLKSHLLSTAHGARYVQELVPGIDIFSSVVLNYSVGGINPFAVYAALKFGAKVVWMPTFDSRHQISFYGTPGAYGTSLVSKDSPPKAYANAKGISILSDSGELIPEVYEILEMIALSDAALGMGHLTNHEMRLLVKAAREAGVTRIFVDHPHIEFMYTPVEEQMEFVKLGALVNYVFVTVVPDGWELPQTPGGVPIEQMVSEMRQIGTENLIISTDLGQTRNMLPVDGMRKFVEVLLDHGITPDEIKTMIQTNPAKMLY